jgi:hypothetical protein
MVDAVPPPERVPNIWENLGVDGTLIRFRSPRNLVTFRLSQFPLLNVFNSESRLAKKRRFGSCCARANAFSYEARASGIRPGLLNCTICGE